MFEIDWNNRKKARGDETRQIVAVVIDGMFEMILMFVCGAKSTKKAQEQVEGKAETRDGRGFEYFVSLSVARSSCPK